MLFFEFLSVFRFGLRKGIRITIFFIYCFHLEFTIFSTVVTLSGATEVFLCAGKGLVSGRESVLPALGFIHSITLE